MSLLLLSSCEQIAGADFDGLARRPGTAGGVDAANTGGALGRGEAGASGGHGGGVGAAAGSAGSGGNGAESPDASDDGSAASTSVGGAASEAGVDAATGPQRVRPAVSDNAIGFGWSVALENDWALVSGRETNGYSFVWLVHRAPNGAWALKQKLPHPVGSSNTGFGGAVALSGQLAIVGAPGGADKPGQAFYFKRGTDDGWQRTGQVQATAPARNDRFGASVALQGNTAAVGAPGESTLSGVVYSYHELGDEQKLAPADLQPYDGFGTTVGMDGDTLVVCAPSDTAKTNATGSAYVYELSSGTWNLRYKLVPSEPDVRGFCSSAALERDTLVIGALGTARGGAAYVYTREPDGSFASRPPQVLEPPEILLSPRNFGISTALCGPTLLIGHEGDERTAGNVFTYRSDTGLWLLSSELQAPTTWQADFGSMIACDAMTAVVSDSINGDDRGAVYFFGLAFQ